MKITIENKTSNDIDVDGNGYLIIPANTKEVYYNELDENTYDMGYYIIKNGYINLALLIDNNEISVFNDYIEFGTGVEFLLFRGKHFKETFKNTKIDFEPDNCGNMWYGLTTNKLNIYNPISKKWYSVQLTENN